MNKNFHSESLDKYSSVSYCKGRQPTPPDFILGYQQSKLRYFNQTQILDLAQRFHDEQVNVSLIVVGAYLDRSLFIYPRYLYIYLPPGRFLCMEVPRRLASLYSYHATTSCWKSELLLRSFNPDFWPDPAGMAATVKELTGAEMMVSLWPSMEDLSVNYLPTQEQGLLATTRDGTGISDSFAGVYTRLSELF